MPALCTLINTPCAQSAHSAQFAHSARSAPPFPLTMHLAVRVALIAALFIASVCARQRCATETHGNLQGLRISLEELSVPHQHTSIQIPNACPPGRRYVGMKISVCDNRLPAVTVSSLNYVEVSLRGSSGNAVAYITEYCARNVAGSQVDDVDDDDQSVSQSENSNPTAYELDSDE